MHASIIILTCVSAVSAVSANVDKRSPSYVVGYSEVGVSYPAYSVPAYSVPAYSVPAYSVPVYSQPGYSEPAYSQPAYSQPAYSQPAYSQQPYSASGQPPGGQVYSSNAGNNVPAATRPGNQGPSAQGSPFPVATGNGAVDMRVGALPAVAALGVGVLMI